MAEMNCVAGERGEWLESERVETQLDITPVIVRWGISLAQRRAHGGALLVSPSGTKLDLRRVVLREHGWHEGEADLALDADVTKSAN